MKLFIAMLSFILDVYDEIIIYILVTYEKSPVPALQVRPDDFYTCEYVLTGKEKHSS